VRQPLSPAARSLAGRAGGLHGSRRGRRRAARPLSLPGELCRNGEGLSTQAQVVRGILAHARLPTTAPRSLHVHDLMRGTTDTIGRRARAGVTGPPRLT